MKTLNSVAAMLMVILGLPTLLFTWIVVTIRGTRPILIRERTMPAPHSFQLRFNVNDDHWMSRLIQRLGLDLEPFLFDVVRRRYSLLDGWLSMSRVMRGRGRARPLQSNVLAGALLGVAAVLLWIAWHGF